MAELICITGTDGSGKNTLIDLLSKERGSVAIANIWDMMDANNTEIPYKSKKDIDNYLCELAPDDRLLFLDGALRFSIHQALNSGKDRILFNAYYYKYFATELALGASENLVNSLIKTFPLPDKVMFLDVSTDVAANRKENYTKYECGLSVEPSKNSFISFQNKAKLFWDTFDKNNWHRLDASLRSEELTQESLKAIQ